MQFIWLEGFKSCNKKILIDLHRIYTKKSFNLKISGDCIEQNKWHSSENPGETDDQNTKKHEASANFVESSATIFTGVTLPQIDSTDTITDESSCDLSFRNPSRVSNIVTGTDIQETDTPSAPESSDYGSADFDYTYGDDHRFTFDSTDQLEDSSKENHDADSGIGTLEPFDQVKNSFQFNIE